MKAKYFFLLSIALAGLMTQSAFAQNDFKIKQRMTMAGQSFDSAVMIKGSRQRSETNMMGMQNVSIMQCDLKRTVDISELEKKYVVTPMDSPLPSEPARRVSTTTTRQPTQAGGTVTQTIELIDTGERKQMFGMTARHIKTIMTTEPSPDACQKGSQRIETDGWYVDLAFGLSCQNDRPVTMPMQSDGGGGCRDKMNMVRKGNAKLGYPLLQTTKIGMGNSGETTTMTTEVLELSKATLSPDLFDIPAGYTEAASRQELYGSATQRAMGQYARTAQPDIEVTRRAPESASTKRPGVVRVGVLPVTNATTRNLSLETYRNNLLAAIVGGNVEAVAIGSDADAQRLNCDFILSTNVKEMKQSAASKFGGVFGKVTGTSTGLAKVESVVSYSLRKISGGPVLSAEATAKVEGDDSSVIASLASEANAVRSFIAKGR